MKLIWSVIAALVIVAAVVLLGPRISPASSTRQAYPPRGSYTVEDLAQRPDQPETLPSGADPARLDAPEPKAEGGAAQAPVRTIGEMSKTEIADRLRADASRITADRVAARSIATDAQNAPLRSQVTPTLPEADTSLDALLNIETPAQSPSETVSAAEVAPPQTSADTPPAPATKDLAANDAVSEVVPMRTKPGEDGWTILDERFPIRGAGTEADPYEVSWELLVSASETYQPRLGKSRLPERIALLNGKYVRVTGYVAFPVMAMEQNELLSMRNMWDGCCIGVPPTPYDAIEVKLKNAATGKERFTAFGVLEGLFKVDPYVKGNWLLGLYLMEQAQIKQTKDIETPKPGHEPL